MVDNLDPNKVLHESKEKFEKSFELSNYGGKLEPGQAAVCLALLSFVGGWVLAVLMNKEGFWKLFRFSYTGLPGVEILCTCGNYKIIQKDLESFYGLEIGMRRVYSAEW